MKELCFKTELPDTCLLQDVSEKESECYIPLLQINTDGVKRFFVAELGEDINELIETNDGEKVYIHSSVIFENMLEDNQDDVLGTESIEYATYSHEISSTIFRQQVITTFATLWSVFTVTVKMGVGATAWQAVDNTLNENWDVDFNMDAWEYWTRNTALGATGAVTVTAIALIFHVIETIYAKLTPGESKDFFQGVLDNLKLFFPAFILDFMWQPWANLTLHADDVNDDLGAFVANGFFMLVNTLVFYGISRFEKASWINSDVNTMVVVGTLFFMLSNFLGITDPVSAGVITASGTAAIGLVNAVEVFDTQVITPVMFNTNKRTKVLWEKTGKILSSCLDRAFFETADVFGVQSRNTESSSLLNNNPSGGLSCLRKSVLSS